MSGRENSLFRMLRGRTDSARTSLPVEHTLDPSKRGERLTFESSNGTENISREEKEIGAAVYQHYGTMMRHFAECGMLAVGWPLRLLTVLWWATVRVSKKQGNRLYVVEVVDRNNLWSTAAAAGLGGEPNSSKQPAKFFAKDFELLDCRFRNAGHATLDCTVLLRPKVNGGKDIQFRLSILLGSHYNNSIDWDKVLAYDHVKQRDQMLDDTNGQIGQSLQRFACEIGRRMSLKTQDHSLSVSISPPSKKEGFASVLLEDISGASTNALIDRFYKMIETLPHFHTNDYSKKVRFYFRNMMHLNGVWIKTDEQYYEVGINFEAVSAPESHQWSCLITFLGGPTHQMDGLQYLRPDTSERQLSTIQLNFGQPTVEWLLGQEFLDVCEVFLQGQGGLRSGEKLKPVEEQVTITLFNGHPVVQVKVRNQLSHLEGRECIHHGLHFKWEPSIPGDLGWWVTLVEKMGPVWESLEASYHRINHRARCSPLLKGIIVEFQETNPGNWQADKSDNRPTSQSDEDVGWAERGSDSELVGWAESPKTTRGSQPDHSLSKRRHKVLRHGADVASYHHAASRAKDSGVALMRSFM
ncbi:hypothetical protein T439DRAFT_221193 [Meredithblackwellia eburnea MCA 4105]